MAWTAPRTWVASEDVTAAIMNAHVRDNFNETAPGKASAAGNMIVTDAVNSIIERTPDKVLIGTSETTTSTSFTDLATAGPAVTADTGTKALVIMTARIANSNAGQLVQMGYAVTSATTIAAAGSRALLYESSVANDRVQASAAYLEEGLTAGSNIFTAKYAVSGGTGTFQHRQLTVIPF